MCPYCHPGLDIGSPSDENIFYAAELLKYLFALLFISTVLVGYSHEYITKETKYDFLKQFVGDCIRKLS